MKYIKLTIVLLAVAGALGGIITLVTKGKVSGEVKPEPTDVKTKTIEKRIHDDIESASDNSFCITAYNDILNSINRFFQNEPSNKATYTLKLQGAYCRKFVKQANYVFDRRTWSPKHIQIIRSELKKCHKFFPQDPSLDSINTILNKYDELAQFNSRVTRACSQKPKCLEDSNYLYKSDNWDVTTTQRLLNNIPQASGKVTNSPVYRDTRTTKVKERLKRAHTQFIESKMDHSETIARAYNFNPNKQNKYRDLGRFLNECFTTYYDLWRINTGHWRKRLGKWQQYVEPQEIEI